MSFGLPVPSLPISYDGELKTANHLKWMAKRKAKDAQLKSGQPFCGVDLPGTSDVLLGRGKQCNEHKGNVKFRSLVDARQTEYENASVQEKKSIAAEIVAAIKKEHGRFLKKEKGDWWVVASDAEACNKANTLFRTERSVRMRAHRTGNAATSKRTKIEAN